MNKLTRIKAAVMAAATAAAAASMSLSIPAAQAEEIVIGIPHEIVTMFGDVNADADIGIADAVQLQRFLLGQDSDLGNWKNADLISDENIDIFDFIKLRKVLTGEEDPDGAKLTVKVVDMMTGEPIEGVGVVLSSEYDSEGGEYSFSLGDWITGDGEIDLSGLPTDEEYGYLLEMTGLPEGYSDAFGGWDSFDFSFDDDEDIKEIVVRLLKDDEERSLDIDFSEWTSGIGDFAAGLIEITDKEGNVFYPALTTDQFALPDGEYHAGLNLPGSPMDLLDPEGEFADELKELFPDEELGNCFQGFDFTVRDGKIGDLPDLFIPEADETEQLPDDIFEELFEGLTSGGFDNLDGLEELF